MHLAALMHIFLLKRKRLCHIDKAACFVFIFLLLLSAVLVILNHALNHLAADASGLTRSKLSVVALLQGHADALSNLVLQVLHGLLGLGYYQLTVHYFSSPYQFIRYILISVQSYLWLF